jgi:hypothetical protein
MTHLATFLSCRDDKLLNVADTGHVQHEGFKKLLDHFTKLTKDTGGAHSLRLVKCCAMQMLLDDRT